MERPKGRTSRPQLAIMLVAAIGIAHFGVGWLDMGKWIVYGVAQEHLRWVIFSLPYVILTLLFVVSLILGGKRRLRVALIALIAAFVASGLTFAYDRSHLRYQLRVPPNGRPYYFFWWWYVQSPPLTLSGAGGPFGETGQHPSPEQDKVPRRE